MSGGGGGEEHAKGCLCRKGYRGVRLRKDSTPAGVAVSFLSAALLSAEYQRRTGKAGFGFLKFGDVDWCDVEASRFDAGAGARERSRENDGAAEGEGVGGVRLGGIDVDPVVAGKWRGVKPGAMGEKRVAADLRDGRFQMQAAGNGHGDNFILVRSEDTRELADAFGVAALGEADKKFAADAKDISTFEGAGKSDGFE